MSDFIEISGQLINLEKVQSITHREVRNDQGEASHHQITFWFSNAKDSNDEYYDFERFTRSLEHEGLVRELFSDIINRNIKKYKEC